MTSKAKQLYLIDRLWNEAWNQKKLSVMHEIFSPSVLVWAGGIKIEGIEPIKSILQTTQHGFPDIKQYQDDRISEENKCTVRWHGIGTHLHEFERIPATGKKFHYSGITIFEFENDSIAKAWLYSNLAEQLDFLRNSP